ncbi:DUF445 family protein [Desulfurobacterium indicum]|uniref:DUF445 domain-containing protein n=1 Tax=Desulfurobacterium indicum TaxID=1914305 RepID=A0A1R1MNF4_9BACT|nr:DUF445 family protein [Desulfurobacterium indicum]OMH41293.1 hypothetical protein BLW93_01080 [Desulfurobacterium indicum]
MNIQLLVPPVVGGIIGYFTNYVAIKMLFRPKKAVYLGKWKLPFTPGLIPSKREKLAVSIAKVVKENLLTEETVRKRLNEKKVKKSIEDLVDKGIDKMIESIPEYMKKIISSITDKKLFEIINITDVERAIHRLVNHLYENRTTIKDLIPESILKRKEEIAQSLTFKILETAQEKLNSDDFLELITEKIQSFMENSGKIPDILIFKKPVKAITTTIATRIVKTLNETIESPAFQETVRTYILQTTDSFLEKEIINLLDKDADKESLSRKITAIIYENFNTSIGDLPLMKEENYRLIASWIKAVIEKNRATLIETTTSKLLQLIEKELPIIMESIDIENLIAEKVNSLPIEEVEGIILKLIDEELKYITLLGGILGFIIGAFQDILFFVK